MPKFILNLSLTLAGASVLVLNACGGKTSDQVIRLAGESVFGPSSTASLTSENGTILEYVPAGVVVSSLKSQPTSAGQTGATKLEVPNDVEESARGRKIKITVAAKVNSSNPSSEFGVAYSTNMNGNSGWFTFTPTASFKAHSFEYLVPEAEGRELNMDFIGLHGDTSAQGKSIIVRAVAVEVLK